jgi:hypothetical protein
MTKIGGFLHILSKKYILDTRLMRPATERVESLTHGSRISVIRTQCTVDVLRFLYKVTATNKLYTKAIDTIKD